MRKIITAVILILVMSASAMAADKNQKWKTMSFTEDISAGLEALRSYCQTHELKVEDVLWANKTEEASLKAGMTIMLPKDRADMLAIWQRTGAWQPTGLVPVVSEAAAKRAMKGKGESTKVVEANVPEQVEVVAQTSKEEPKLKAKSTAKTAKSRAKKQQTRPETAQTQAIAQTPKEEPKLKVASTAKTAKARSKTRKAKPENAQVIAQTPKGDTQLQDLLVVKPAQTENKEPQLQAKTTSTTAKSSAKTQQAKPETAQAIAQTSKEDTQLQDLLAVKPAQTENKEPQLQAKTTSTTAKSSAKTQQAKPETAQAIAQTSKEDTQLQDLLAVKPAQTENKEPQLQPKTTTKTAKARAKTKQPKTSSTQTITKLLKEDTQLHDSITVKPTTPLTAKTQKSKPDKILTAKKTSTQQDIPGLMDPIIILSPNGDPTNGPMRLIISGDKVEVVKLPQNALPKKPTMTDANAPFTSSYSYLPYYDLTGRQRSSIMTNLNSFTSLNGKMMWPVDGRISSPFGKWRGKHRHEGIDIPMPSGTPIRAAKNGVVIRTGNNSTIGFRGYGNFVMLDHGGGVRTFYAHCLSVAVQPGQRIMQGQIIAYVGNTGRSTASHLHFEVRINDTKVNPVPYLAGNTHLASHK